MMELKQLQYFLVCAETGSITKAAEELYTSQPHVSQVVKSLETELGVRLFSRTGNGILLTEQGDRIRTYAENAFKNISLINETCENKGGTALRIATNSSSTLTEIAEDIYCKREAGHFSMNYMECSIEDMMDYLQYKQYEIGFLFLAENKLMAFRQMIEKRHLEYVSLSKNDLIVYSGKAGSFYTRDVIEPYELNNCKCVQNEDDFFSIEDILYEDENFRKGNVRVDIAVRTNSNRMIMSMLRKTDCCSIGSYWSQKDLGIRHAHMTRINKFQGKISFGFLKNAGVPLSEAAEEFLDRIRSILASTEEPDS